jgi:hypothetical protein
VKPKPPLTPEFCLQVIVNSTPFPSRFKPPKTASTTTLFDLGVVDKDLASIFVEGVKSRIFPWHIDSTDVASSRDTSLQEAADSVQNNAF